MLNLHCDDLHRRTKTRRTNPTLGRVQRGRARLARDRSRGAESPPASWPGVRLSCGKAGLVAWMLATQAHAAVPEEARDHRTELVVGRERRASRMAPALDLGQEHRCRSRGYRAQLARLREPRSVEPGLSLQRTMPNTATGPALNPPGSSPAGRRSCRRGGATRISGRKVLHHEPKHRLSPGSASSPDAVATAVIAGDLERSRAEGRLLRAPARAPTTSGSRSARAHPHDLDHHLATRSRRTRTAAPGGSRIVFRAVESAGGPDEPPPATIDEHGGALKTLPRAEAAVGPNCLQDGRRISTSTSRPATAACRSVGKAALPAGRHRRKGGDIACVCPRPGCVPAATSG